MRYVYILRDYRGDIVGVYSTQEQAENEYEQDLHAGSIESWEVE